MTIVERIPDGTKTTLGPYTSDPVGTIFVTITPTETGNYTFQGFFPGHLISESPNGIDPTLGSGSSLCNSRPRKSHWRLAKRFMYLAGLGQETITNHANPTSLQSQCNQRPFHLHPLIHYQLNTGEFRRLSGHVENWQYITGDCKLTKAFHGIIKESQFLPEDNIGGIINDYTSPPTTDHIAWTLPIQDDGGVAGLPQALACSVEPWLHSTRYFYSESYFSFPIIYETENSTTRSNLRRHVYGDQPQLQRNSNQSAT